MEQDECAHRRWPSCGSLWVAPQNTVTSCAVSTFCARLVKPSGDSRGWVTPGGNDGALAVEATRAPTASPCILYVPYGIGRYRIFCSLVRVGSGDIVGIRRKIKNPQSRVGCGFLVVPPAGFELATPGLEETNSSVYGVAPMRWSPCPPTKSGLRSVYAVSPKIRVPWLHGDAVVTDNLREISITPHSRTHESIKRSRKWTLSAVYRVPLRPPADD